MNPAPQPSGSFHQIPTTVVTGFLGAGKTTAINHLLSIKPPMERWAVLVNEFGKIGVDGALLAPHSGVSIREIAGGCLCCTAGQAFEVGLNRLIRETDPDRILIEPTGIGHPMKIIRTLLGPYYRGVLDLKATITLLDARKLADARYREHPSFQDQLSIADVLVANKAECYTPADREAFLELVATSHPPKLAHAFISFGRLDMALLELPRTLERMAAAPETLPRPRPEGETHDEREAVSAETWRLHEGAGKGYCSASWLIGNRYQFSREELSALLLSLPFTRVKGVMQCREGWLKINGGEGEIAFSAATPLECSRLELIERTPLPCKEIERRLREALVI